MNKINDNKSKVIIIIISILSQHMMMLVFVSLRFGPDIAWEL